MYRYTMLSTVQTRTEESNLNYDSNSEEWRTFERVPSITMRWTASEADKAGLCQQPVNEDKRGGGGLLEVRSIIYLSLSLSLFVSLCLTFSPTFWKPGCK